MDYFVIEVPDMNDSVVKVSLQSRLYQLRFTWNDTGGYWMLGVMDSPMSVHFFLSTFPLDNSLKN